MNKVSIFSIALICALLTTVSNLNADEFYLKDGQRVIFFGDSITQNGRYVTYVETYLRTRFPNQRFEVINHGISSETISGTTEKDHDPPRPHALPRFARDVAAWKPDVVVSCFGMNDGNYHPFDKPRFKKYQEGNRILARRTKQEAKAALVLLTPPPFDPYRRRVLDPEATEFGYKFSAINYDETLHQYSRWLLSLRKEGITVFDLHGPMNLHLAKRRAKKVSFTLSPDGIHPNQTGHWLMAQQLLLGWNAPAKVDVAELDLTDQSFSSDLKGVLTENNTISFAWKTKLPMPIDPRWDAESIALERLNQRLNVHRLKVNGLKPGEYQLLVDHKLVAVVTADALAAGLDLTKLEKFPTNRLSLEVLNLVHQRRQLVYGDWRGRIKKGEIGLASFKHPRAQEIDAQLRKLCQPRELSVSISQIAK